MTLMFPRFPTPISKSSKLPPRPLSRSGLQRGGAASHPPSRGGAWGAHLALHPTWAGARKPLVELQHGISMALSRNGSPKEE